MADITPITNLRGPAARIIEASASTLPAGTPASVTMTGPDQGRKFHFGVPNGPRGLPGVNAVENDEAVATYVGAPDSDTRGALDSSFGWALLVTDPQFGAIGDGVADDTAAIQAAVDRAYALGGATVVIPPGVYMIAADSGNSIWANAGGIQMRDGVTLSIGAGATLRALPVATPVSKIVRIHDCENVTITGSGTIDGNRSNATVATGEWGYGVSINAGSNILVEGVRTINCWGDGVNIQRLSQADVRPPHNVTVRGIVSDNNRRQGCSIESGSNVLIENNVFSNTNGTLPSCGLDIEPADADGTIDFVTIRNNQFIGNARAGLQLWESTKCNNILVEKNNFDSNGTNGATPQLRFVVGGVGMHIRGNTFRNSPGQIAATVGGPARDGIIADNHLDKDLEVTGTAIIAGFPKSVTVSGNTLVGGTLRFSYVLGFTIERNYIRPAAGRPCIDLTSVATVQYGRVRDNYLEGGTKGILGNPTSPASFLSILDNTFQHQSEQAITIKGGDTVTITGNIFEGCCLTSGASIIEDLTDVGGALRRRIERNTFKLAPRSGGPVATNTPTAAYASAATMLFSWIGENILIGALSMFPNDQATGGGTVAAALGKTPARESTRRPSSPPTGTMFFDTTLGKPIWFRNTQWIDSAGAVVP